MAKPHIMQIRPFDANYDYEISISWLGNRAHANRIVIYDYKTNDLIFDDTVSTYALKHTIPAHTLTNGRNYIIQAQTFDVENIASPLSDKVMFYAFETPEFYFRDIKENLLIDNSSFTVSVYYYSPDFEDINKFVFYLYDATKKELLHSEEFIDNNEYNMNYTYKGLDNDTVYYIRCTGVTVNGMELDTGYIEIMVKFENPNTYARIYAIPRPEQGCIQVSTNLIIIDYTGDDVFDYIDGTMIDLRDKVLYYDQGFNIDGDFTVLIRGMHLWQTKEIFAMENDKFRLSLSSRIYTDGTLRFRLLVPNGIGDYLLYSEPLVFNNEDMMTIGIRRVNDVYQLKVFEYLNYTAEGNMWYGKQRPNRDYTTEGDQWIDDTDGETYIVSKDEYTTYLDEEEPLDAKINDLWLGGAW